MRSGKQNDFKVKHIIIGVVLAIILTILMSAISAIFLDNESIGLNLIPYISVIIWLVSGFVSAFCAGYAGEGNWILRSIIATGIYYVILLGVGILLFDGVDGDVVVGLIAGVIGFVLALFAISRKRKMPMNRKLKNFKFG